MAPGAFCGAGGLSKVFCDDAEDCPMGKVCCLVPNPSGMGSDTQWIGQCQDPDPNPLLHSVCGDNSGGVGRIRFDGAGNLEGTYLSANGNQPIENGTFTGTYALHVNSSTGLPDGSFDLTFTISENGNVIVLNAVFSDRGHAFRFVQVSENGMPSESVTVGNGAAE